MGETIKDDLTERVNPQDTDLKEFYRVLGLTATVDILKSIEQGKNQYKDFFLIASVATINKRTKQLVQLGVVEHHIERKPKRKEWYTLTERGKRITKAILRLEKAFQGG